MNKGNEKIAETEKQANKNARQKEKRTAKNKATVDKEQMKIMFMPTWNVRDLKDKEKEQSMDKALTEGGLDWKKYKETIKEVAKKVCGTTKIKGDGAKGTE
ncbi:hypothetical protein ILUMI_09854 [Ignelater luminosus]|uniref:Uncharacterized protein n=1 Tax=Ignelater luminosus TaxID=2038154 RepID=A0A8K0D343_IGNLU|nr:hypothetical protein ILUMI_09854 [Ignelater luminosus]